MVLQTLLLACNDPPSRDIVRTGPDPQDLLNCLSFQRHATRLSLMFWLPPASGTKVLPKTQALALSSHFSNHN